MPPTKTIEERVAVLEARMDMDDEDRAERRRELDAHLSAIHRALDTATNEMNRYKGFVGGISLVVSILGAGVAFFKDAISTWLSK